MVTKLKLLLLLLLTCMAAQSQNTGYAAYSKIQYISKVISTSDNGYLAIGRLGQKGFVMKLNSVFDVLWSKELTSGANSYPRNCIVTKNGNYIVHFWYSKNNNSAIGILKFAPNGNLIHQKCLYSASGDLISSVNLCRSQNDDGFLIGGGNCIGSNFVIKCDDATNVVWSKEFLKSSAIGGVQTVFDIIIDNENYMLASGANADVQLIQIDNSGTVLNYKSIPNAQGNENPQQIIKLANGKYVVACFFTTGNSDNFYYFVDANMSSVVSKKFALNNDYHFTMLEYEPNKITIGGSSFISTSSAKRNFYFAIDDVGNIIWSKLSDGKVSTNLYDEIWASTSSVDKKKIIFGGTSFGDKGTIASIDFNGLGYCAEDNSTLITSNPYNVSIQNSTSTVVNLGVLTDTSSATLKDTLISKNLLCGQLEPVSVNDIDLVEKTIKISPNPCHDMVTIDTEENLPSSFTIVDALGNIVTKVNTINSKSASIHTASFSKGLYFVVLPGSESRAVKFFKN